jgi:hypothetical protein
MNIGGISGYNAGGVLEYVQSDAEINVNNATKLCVGGLSGQSIKGIISYALCRGSINIKNTRDVCAAQVSGYSTKGLFEKMITTTGIEIDNSEKSSVVNVGMVLYLKILTILFLANILHRILHISREY